MRRVVLYGWIVLITVLLLGCDVASPPPVSPSGSPAAENALIVRVLDVGQADAILLKQGDVEMLIDGGNNEDGPTVVSSLRALGVQDLEYLVATHAHEDHVGGLDAVLAAFTVKTIWVPSSSSSTASWTDFISAAAAEGCGYSTPAVGTTISVGGAVVSVVGPAGSSYSDANDYSLVLRSLYGGKSMLFMGDAEAASEAELLSKGLTASVLKVAHHGSSSSSSRSFIEPLGLLYAVCSVGAGNSYGHPATSTVDRFYNAHVKLYRTDLHGQITIYFTEGGSIRVDYPKGSEPSVSPHRNPYQESVQCYATTQAGSRCSRMTTNLSGRCWQHE